MFSYFVLSSNGVTEAQAPSGYSGGMEGCKKMSSCTLGPLLASVCLCIVFFVLLFVILCVSAGFYIFGCFCWLFFHAASYDI